MYLLRNRQLCFTNGLVRGVALFLLSLAAAEYALATCDPGQQQVANKWVQQARASTDDAEKLVLLKKSLKACQGFVVWLELGQAQLALGGQGDAVESFENARDFYRAQNDGSLTRSQLRRRAISNSLLADAYKAGDDLARASVAIREAQIDYGALKMPTPARLIRLRAEIDDAMAEADAAVLARSFELQHQRQSRGIGVRPVVNDKIESVQIIAETEALAEQYGSGDNVSTIADESVELVADTGADADTDADTASTANNVQLTVDQSAAVDESITASKLDIPVLFEFDSAALTAVSRQTVDRLGQALNALKLDSAATITVVGHTDSRGSSAYNKSLSLKRARTVLGAIEKLATGTPTYRVIGMGEEQLRYSGQSKDDHRRNRRVEIIVER